MIRPSRLIKLIILLFTVLLSSTIAAPTKQVSKTPAYRITAIKAMLFYQTTGTFSRDVLAKPDFIFWNTIIGEGDAEESSTSTLVLIEVTGRSSPEERLPSRRVEFVATTEGKTILRKTAEIRLFSEDERFYAPFWLYDTGCWPIKISVRILGQKQPSTMTKIIPFECGE